MNNQGWENNIDNGFFVDDFEKYEVSEAIQERAQSAKNFALVSMIVSGVLFLLLIGSFGFSLLFPSVGFLAILALPLAIGCAVLEILLMIGAIVLNIIALVRAIKQRKEFNLYKDGPEKDKLETTLKLGRIFTYIGVGVAALALIMIIPLNLLEFVLSFL